MVHLLWKCHRFTGNSKNHKEMDNKHRWSALWR